MVLEFERITDAAFAEFVTGEVLTCALLLFVLSVEDSNILFAAPAVRGPKYPVLEILLAIWNALTASLVNER